MKLIRRPSGLILLNGPTGSGKTTAIYSALCHLVETHGPTVSISTVEDPVEFNLPMISQSQISNSRGFTYPKALRSLMRQDPEAIMIGEIRDPETASIAVQAGLTGHMVISTIHSDSTAGVYARLINMNIEPFLLASSIAGVLGLRLLRTICEHCKVETQPNAEQIGLMPEEFVQSTTFYTGQGCDHCADTGYHGRVAVTELLMSDEVTREGIIQKMRTRKLRDLAIDQGMTTLWQNALAKVQRGVTSMDEVIRIVAVDQLDSPLGQALGQTQKMRPPIEGRIWAKLLTDPPWPNACSRWHRTPRTPRGAYPSLHGMRFSQGNAFPCR